MIRPMDERDPDKFQQSAAAVLWNYDGNRNEPTTEFYARLLEIDYEAVELRQDTIDIPVELTGYTALRSLNEFENQCGDLHEELLDAREAIDHHQPYEFERVERGFRSKDQNAFLDKRNKIANQLNATFEEVERTRNTITSKRTEAVTRMSTIFPWEY